MLQINKRVGYFFERLSSVLLSIALLFLANDGHCQQMPTPNNLTQLAGWKVIQDPRLGNCITCHTIAWSGSPIKEKQGNFAPPLSTIGAKYSREQLLQWITDARVLQPETLMPPYGSQKDIKNPLIAKPILDAKQINDVVDFLVLLK